MGSQLISAEDFLSKVKVQKFLKSGINP